MSDKNIRSAVFNWQGHETDTETETDAETGTDTETDTETEMDMETDMDTVMELEYFCWISIQRYSRYCAVWITCDTSRRKFQQRYKLVAPLPNEYYDILTAIGTSFQIMC